MGGASSMERGGVRLAARAASVDSRTSKARVCNPIDAPELDPYRGTIDFLKEQLLSMNAGSAELSF